MEIPILPFYLTYEENEVMLLVKAQIGDYPRLVFDVESCRYTGYMPWEGQEYQSEGPTRLLALHGLYTVLRTPQFLGTERK